MIKTGSIKCKDILKHVKHFILQDRNVCLNTLIKSLQQYLQDDPYLSRDFKNIITFYKKSISELNALKINMDNRYKAINNGDEFATTEDILTASQALRQEFHKIHTEFLTKIDCIFAIHITVYNPTIEDALLIARKYANIYINTNSESDKNKIIELNNIINYFMDNRKPIMERLISDDCIIKAPVNYDEISTLEDKQAHIKSIIIFYDSMLNELRLFMLNKIHFRRSTANILSHHCNDILQITGEKTIAKPKGLFVNPEAEARKKDLINVYNFIIENQDFYFAAFSTDRITNLNFRMGYQK